MKVLNLMTSLMSVGVAKEGSALVMRTSACVGFRSFGWSTSAVLLHLIFRVLLTPFHTAIVRDEPVLCRPGRFRSRRNQALHDIRVALKCSTAQFWCSPAVFPSDCLPDVPHQLSDCAEVAGECPRSVRVSEVPQHAR